MRFRYFPFFILILLTSIPNNVSALNLVINQEDILKLSEIDKVPIFPGCDQYNSRNTDLRACMSQKITKFVLSEFRINKAQDIGLSGTQRISVIFRINKKGKVVDVRARAPHPSLVKEAVRAVSSLPMMEPATVDGKAVIVPYSLPIIFQLSNQSFVLPTTPD